MVVQLNNVAKRSGFTIVELLIVIVVIAILATITTVSYNGIAKRAAIASLQSDLRQSVDQLGSLQVDNGAYPLTASFNPNTQLKHSPDTTLEYTSDGTTYCITAASAKAQDNYYFDLSTGKPVQGKCTGHTGYAAGGGVVADGAIIQTITSANCPATSTRAVDARDSHSYWVKQLADGKCWMLTNLAYAGGGTNTYNDVDTLTNGTGGATTYTVASYYVVPSTTNYRIEPDAPSTSTDGGVTGSQYGYLYNWCAAMGGQTSTSACANATTPLPNTAISVCPAGWRLPTGNGGELGALNSNVNTGSTTDDTGLRSAWLGQWGGYWNSSFSNQGSAGNYWSSTQYSAAYGYRINFKSTSVDTASNNFKYFGFAVRCLAN
jgi:uncharacterized protein (TIGR02145 family)/prepilin-type N-terminal cleavage/methylation domain-containing protein